MKVEDVLAALAHPARREMVELLRHQALSFVDLANRPACSRPMVAKHLRQLQDAQLIARYDFEDNGRYLYTYTHEGVAELRKWLQRFG